MIDRRMLLLTAVSGFAHIGKTVTLPPVSKAFAEVLRLSGAPALGYAVVGPKGIVTSEVSGLRRVDGEATATIDDLWHIGSNTEAMTAALYAKMVEGGLGAWQIQVPYLFPDIQIDPGWSAVTIEDLLSHHSGASDLGVIDEGWLIRVTSDPKPIMQQRADFAAKVLASPPAGKRGQYLYANTNYILVGAAIERLSKQSWEDTITVRLFEPLDMNSAGFGAPIGDEPWGHELNGQGIMVAVDPKGVADNPPIFGPAGRVRLTLGDYAKFAAMFLNGGGGYLNPDSLGRLARPQGGGMDGDALGWRLTHYKAWADGPVLDHEGSNTLWRAMAQIAPAKPLAILVVCNAGGGAGARAVAMLSSRLIADQSKPADDDS